LACRYRRTPHLARQNDPRAPPEYTRNPIPRLTLALLGNIREVRHPVARKPAGIFVAWPKSRPAPLASYTVAACTPKLGGRSSSSFESRRILRRYVARTFCISYRDTTKDRHENPTAVGALAALVFIFVRSTTMPRPFCCIYCLPLGNSTARVEISGEFAGSRESPKSANIGYPERLGFVSEAPEVSGEFWGPRKSPSIRRLRRLHVTYSRNRSGGFRLFEFSSFRVSQFGSFSKFKNLKI